MDAVQQLEAISAEMKELRKHGFGKKEALRELELQRQFFQLAWGDGPKPAKWWNGSDGASSGPYEGRLNFGDWWLSFIGQNRGWKSTIIVDFDDDKVHNSWMALKTAAMAKN